MATYLATATNGTFQTDFDGVANGHIPLYNAVDPNTKRRSSPAPEPDLAWERLAPRAGDHRLARERVRRVPVPGGRRDRRLGPRRGLRARVADQAQLRDARRA